MNNRRCALFLHRFIHCPPYFPAKLFFIITEHFLRFQHNRPMIILKGGSKKHPKQFQNLRLRQYLRES
jgi:hypothetical protein